MKSSARFAILILLAGLTLARPAIAASQPSMSAARPAPRADSTRVARTAKRAQSDFEATRRARLPTTPSGVSGRCDVQIGRFCYWYEDTIAEPPAEPPVIAEARDRFLARLDSAAAAHPGDEWIAGQRVRYLVEAGRTQEAISAARECTGSGWWCQALNGFALHTATRFAEAEAAFDQALGAMPERKRCAWLDLTPLLEDRAAARLRRIPCAERDSADRAIWRLAQPLWSREGNDARTEHFSRHMMAQLEKEARSPHNLPWGDDMRELLIRYGWPTAWSRELASMSSASAQSYRIIGHEPSPSFVFVPPARALDSLTTLDADDWALRSRDVPTRYAPAYADAFVGISHQLATFRRGDSARVVAAWDVRTDTTFAGDSISISSALALRAMTGERLGVARGVGTGRRGALTATAPWTPLLVSLEISDSAARRYGRARLATRATRDSARSFSLSDLLLLAGTDSPPASLDDAIPLARGSTRVPAGSKLGVFWEVYGLDSGSADTLTYAITVARRDASWLRRTVERIGISDRPAPYRMIFSEPPVSSGGVVARTLAVDLAQLPPGRYTLILTASLDDQAAAKATREIEVVR